ncbi:MAG: TIM barrel protein [Pseudohongiella sp.]|nr:TIM barrel protein [Pseudohongiella sp.]
MNRRDFVSATVVAGLMSNVLARRSYAQAAPSIPPLSEYTQVPGLDAYSRYLHWLRNPIEIAEACRELTCNSLLLSVGEGSAHVPISNVATELPRFVSALRREGIEVRQIRGGNQTDVDVDVERLVATMTDLGIHTYWLGTDRYDFSQPVMPQLDAIKRKVERFVRLNERHGTRIQYHTRSNASSVGSVVWDLLYIMGDFDPQYVGIHWDTGHMSNHGAMWETLFRTAVPYLATISWKDRRPVQDPRIAADQLNHSIRGLGWGYEDVALGTGWVDFFRYGEILREIGYTGLMDLQAEYDNSLGGANHGNTELTLPRDVVLGAIKRDVLTVRTALQESGSGIVV